MVALVSFAICWKLLDESRNYIFQDNVSSNMEQQLDNCFKTRLVKTNNYSTPTYHGLFNQIVTPDKKNVVCLFFNGNF